MPTVHLCCARVHRDFLKASLHLNADQRATVSELKGHLWAQSVPSAVSPEVCPRLACIVCA